MRAAVFIGVELVFLAAAQVWGGPPWVGMGVLAFVVQIAAGMRPAALPMLVAALGWLALFRLTGDRECFFPYCMHLAAQAAACLAPRSVRAAAAGGALIVAAFLAIRVLQGARGRVLTVETIVAVAILGGVAWALGKLPRRPAVDAGIVAAAAGLAYLGLAL